MKAKVLMVVLAAMVMVFSGCTILKDVVMIPVEMATIKPIPTPRPGMVLLTNENEGTWAEILGVFRGSWSERDLVGIDSRGQLTITRRPILFWVSGDGYLFAEDFLEGKKIESQKIIYQFRISSALGAIYEGSFSTPTTRVIFLPPHPAEYTVLVRYRNTYGNIVSVNGKSEEAIRFRTQGYPFEYDSRFMNLDGTRIGADRIIRLSRVQWQRDTLPGGHLVDINIPLGEMIRRDVDRTIYGLTQGR